MVHFVSQGFSYYSHLFSSEMMSGDLPCCNVCKKINKRKLYMISEFKDIQYMCRKINYSEMD